MRAITMGLVLAAGCSARDADGDGIPDELPYVFDDADAGAAPSLGAAEVEDALVSAFDGVLDRTAGPVLDAYDAVMAEADDDCPNLVVANGQSYWTGPCTTASGVQFEGFGQGFDGYDTGVDTRGFYASATVTFPDGRQFVSGGYAAFQTGVTGDITFGVSDVEGQFAWDGVEAEGTWLDRDEDVELAQTWQIGDDFTARTFDGTLVASDGTALAFDDVVVVDPYCVGEPSGVVSLRAEDGWYDVIFDLDTDDIAGMDPALCDGCGTVWHRGVELGEACVDVAALGAVVEAPW